MKKYLFIALATATLASCSQDEVMEIAEKQAISFGSAFVGNSTRVATDYTYGTSKLVEKFNVYGTVKGNTDIAVNIFNGDAVTKPNTIGNTYDDSKEWTCNKVQYWVVGADYNFAAVVNEDIVTVATDATTGMPTKLTYTTDSTSTKDLLYATQTVENASENPGLVKFTFDHLLSKVWFTVNSSAPEGYHYNVENIKISNYYDAEYDISTGLWTGKTTENFNIGNVREVTQSSGSKTNAFQMLLIPNAQEYIITFTVNLYVDGKLTNSQNYSSKVNHELKKGYSYNFNIDLRVGNQILFTVTNVNTWLDDNDNPTTTDKTETFIPVSLTPAA